MDRLILTYHQRIHVFGIIFPRIKKLLASSFLIKQLIFPYPTVKRHLIIILIRTQYYFPLLPF